MSSPLPPHSSNQAKQELSSPLPPHSSNEAKQELSSPLPPHSSNEAKQELSSPLPPHSSNQAKQELSSPLPPHSSNEAKQELSSPLPPHSSNEAKQELSSPLPPHSSNEAKQELSSPIPPHSSNEAKQELSSPLPPHSSNEAKQELSSPLPPHSSNEAKQELSSPIPPQSSYQAGAHPIIIIPTTAYQQQYNPTVLQSPGVFHFPTPLTTPTLAMQGQVLVPVQRQMQRLPTIQSPNVKTQISNPTVLFAKGLFSAQRFTEFQQLISTTSFPDSALLELRDLWLESVYSSHILKTGSSLTTMIRYRLRKRHPFPRTIWNGENTSYNVKQSSRDYLTSYYTLNPYPTAAERRIIARDTGMEYKSVSHWFLNTRSRNKGNQITESSSDTSSYNSILAASNELAELADSLLYNQNGYCTSRSV